MIFYGIHSAGEGVSGVVFKFLCPLHIKTK